MTPRSSINKMAAQRLARSSCLGISLIILTTVVSSITGSEELLVRHAPNHVRFLKDAGSLSTKDVEKVITASYGFDNDEVLGWSGLAHTSAFKRPKATVLISVPGFTDSRLETDASTQRYQLSHAQEMIDTAAVINSIQSGFMEHRPLIVDMKEQDMTQYPKVFQDMLNVDQASQDNELSLMNKLGSLNTSRQIDWAFVSELEIIRRLVKAVEMETTAIQDAIPDFFHFYVHGYQHIVDHYGSDSPQARDARKLLNTVISWVTDTFRRLYKDNVVVLVVTLGSHPNPSHGLRYKRDAGQPSLTETATKQNSTEDQKKFNTADAYSNDFPAIFTIILFTSIILILAALGVSYCMWFMDPGRDSIIYRMTSQRIKKD